MYAGDLGVTFLDFDGTLRVQALQLDIPSEWIDCADLPGTRGLCDPFAARALAARLQHRRWRGITFIGRGNHHYVTYLLLRELREPFSLVLFDHHTDLSPDPNAMLSCGSWVSHALRDLPCLRRVVIVGASADAPAPSDDPRLTVLPEASLISSTPRSVLDKIIRAAGRWPIYISVDKDVLLPKDAATDWDAGTLSLGRLLYWLVGLRRGRRIVGIDICGEWPVDPLALLSRDVMRQIQKNQTANRAIVRALRCG
ncbi:arginase family protein [Alicyclobacillus sp.]|uniref:arginase family protein n=1 Tax=Alicyclobacillus sp. TaxID=61169 RepID=UPI0025C1FFF2|nr:arginase family protein [Alicyclobacillus sp.]MCL6516990.1 arginase family protein [Alicyclobacillus sp.]